MDWVNEGHDTCQRHAGHSLHSCVLCMASCVLCMSIASRFRHATMACSDERSSRSVALAEPRDHLRPGRNDHRISLNLRNTLSLLSRIMSHGGFFTLPYLTFPRRPHFYDTHSYPTPCPTYTAGTQVTTHRSQLTGHNFTAPSIAAIQCTVHNAPLFRALALLALWSGLRLRVLPP